jgi:type II secretory ATPase GspE/PulE/Tfp pilus assembly ATPase PilB-like protein
VPWRNRCQRKNAWYGSGSDRNGWREQTQSGTDGNAIFEALIVDDEVKIAIQERAPSLHLQRILERRGERFFFEKAVREAAEGVISLEEACKFREVGSTISTA